MARVLKKPGAFTPTGKVVGLADITRGLTPTVRQDFLPHTPVERLPQVLGLPTVEEYDGDLRNCDDSAVQ